MKLLYDLIWGQCTKSLRSRLRGVNYFIAYSTIADSLALLKAIRSEMTGFHNILYLPHALHKVMRDFYSLIQRRHQSNQEYYDEFNSLVLTGEECGATIGPHPGAKAVDARNPMHLERKETIKIATDQYLAVTFLVRSDRIRYDILIEETENAYLQNWNNLSKVGTYPTTVAEAYDYLCK
jgi:hypothetical protein